ncbi:MAG: hypothetical protein RL154_608 [Pseudomonadota bacterium]|jgi:signal transduction histidine kinase
MYKIFIFLLIIPIYLFASKQIIIDENLSNIISVESFKIYEDTNKSLSIDDILNNKNLIAIKPDKFLGVQSGIFWLVFDIKNSSSKNVSYVLSNPRLNNSGIVYIASQNSLIEQNLSNFNTFLNFPMKSIAVLANANDSSKVVLMLDFESARFIYPYFKISSQSSFDKNIMVETMYKSLTCGALIALLIYNLFIFRSFKSRVNAWYIAYLGTVLLFLLSNNGLGYEYIWGWSSFISQNSFALAYPLMFAAALKFSTIFLQTKVRFPKIDIVLKFSMYILLSLQLLIFADHGEFVVKFFAVAALCIGFLPVVGIYAWQKGHTEARFYVLAWAVWSVCNIPSLLLIIGFNLEYEHVVMAARTGLLFETVVLAFALADQIKVLQNERDSAIAKYEAQKASQEINERFAQMGQMIAAIGHQWKQPLQLSSLHIIEIEFLLNENAGTINKGIKTELDKIQVLINYMASTIDDFKNFFQPSKTLKYFNAVQMISSIVKMIGKQFEYEDIAINISGDEDLKFFGKENELKQVIINILNNAKDAFESVEYNSKKIDIALLKRDSFAIIEISDNAGGIAQNIIDSVFDQFFTTKGSEGTGFGLYICKTIIEDSFNGSVKVSNFEGGAKFTISLPLSL